MWKTKVLGFLSKAVPNKIKSKLVGRALQKAPAIDCGVFAKAREANRATYNAIRQNREIGKAIDVDEFKEVLNSNKEAMAVIKNEIFAAAKPVQVKGLYDGPTAKSVASKSKDKDVMSEFFDKTGRAVDDEEMCITQSFIDKKLGHSSKTTLKTYNAYSKNS